MPQKDLHNRIKDFLLRFASKEFLVFLFFLAVSSAFWFLSSLNESYDEDIAVPLVITDIPENIVITEGLPDTVRVTVHGKGFELLRYSTMSIPQIPLKFANYAKKNGLGVVTLAELTKIIRTRLESSVQIVSVKADHLDFYYNNGQKKRVPIVTDGSIEPKEGYYISDIKMNPDSATVYATKEALDTIFEVFTAPIRVDNLSTSFSTVASLQHIKGTKIEPSAVTVDIFADLLTEKVVNVPITTINTPEDITVKTFPSRVDIRVAVGVKRKDFVKADQFTVVADCHELNQGSNERLQIKIQASPKFIVKATLPITKVDYLIEK